jgi:hypothetical protein
MSSAYSNFDLKVKSEQALTASLADKIILNDNLDGSMPPIDLHSEANRRFLDRPVKLSSLIIITMCVDGTISFQVDVTNTNCRKTTL